MTRVLRRGAVLDVEVPALNGTPAGEAAAGGVAWGG